MTCPVCFFRNDTQKGLKTACFGISRFEDRLRKYKDSFIYEINKMDSWSICNKCNSKDPHSVMIAWLDAFCDQLKSNTLEIEKTFDDIVGCYEDFIAKNQKVAIENFWHFLEKNGLKSNVPVSDSTYDRCWFRGRKRDKKDPFDEQDIKEFFHISFDKRERIRNQRFSINGQPMLYLGASLLTVAKELECDINELATSKSLPRTQCWNLGGIRDLAVSAFLPNSSKTQDWKIHDLRNSYGDLMWILKQIIVDSNANVFYYDPRNTPNYFTFEKDIKRAVLMQLCTFPTKTKRSFIPEYVLPQILTTALMEHDYKGIIYPSTKDFGDLTNYNGEPVHELNLGLFTCYRKDRNIDEELLNSFSTYVLDGSESFNFTEKDIEGECEITRNLLRKGDYSQKISDSRHINRLKSHIEDLGSSQLNGTSYFDTPIGKTELELYMKVLYDIKKRILDELGK